MVDAVEICKKVLARLSAMDFEKAGGSSSEQLIFPQKVQAKGTKLKDRISEQELRLLFIEEFKEVNKNLFYSIETPTEEKYKFGDSYNEIVKNVDVHKTSASIDMCVFESVSDKYERILNIEFKHKNTKDKNIAKDILKLLREKQDGSFIHLLNNTDSGTLRNAKETGVFDKLHKSFTDFKGNWNNENKSIQLIILSLKQEILIHREICKTDLDNLKEIFFIDTICGNMTEIKGKEWDVEHKINSNE
jgi:hypothetical protein